MSGKHAQQNDLDATAKAIVGGDRVALGRAITLIESAKPEDQARAQILLENLLPRTGKAIRVGISGVPGAGKSTLIDQLGLNLVAKGKKVAVLAVDPTSTRSGGSILGDKTRMGRLASEQGAFIRPSPAGDSLGGVTKTTRETIALAEAAGYNVVLVETVGVGQSETAVSNMVDVFVVVGIPGAGDELQGIKRGLLELADVIAVNKADGDQVERANRAAMEYRTALHILAAGNPNWSPVVLTVSARDNAGLDELWTKVEERHSALSRLWKVPVRPAQLTDVAATLGADVPFFLAGGTALGLGRGDEVYPLADLPRHWIVLLVPGFGVSTARRVRLVPLRARSVARRQRAGAAARAWTMAVPRGADDQRPRGADRPAPSGDRSDAHARSAGRARLPRRCRAAGPPCSVCFRSVPTRSPPWTVCRDRAGACS